MEQKIIKAIQNFYDLKVGHIVPAVASLTELQMELKLDREELKTILDKLVQEEKIKRLKVINSQNLYKPINV